MQLWNLPSSCATGAHASPLGAAADGCKAPPPALPHQPHDLHAHVVQCSVWCWELHHGSHDSCEMSRGVVGSHALAALQTGQSLHSGCAQREMSLPPSPRVHQKEQPVAPGGGGDARSACAPAIRIAQSRAGLMAQHDGAPRLHLGNEIGHMHAHGGDRKVRQHVQDWFIMILSGAS